MAVDKIDVESDPRVEKCTAYLNGRTYGYLLGVPSSGDFVGTIFLIHGWPDLSMGWRYQIPMLLELGFRVVCPDSIGYGRTDAPVWSEHTASEYTFKTAADDMKALAEQLGVSRIILGGHDWGGAIVYRIALWYPDLVSHIFAVCTPYTPPTDRYFPLEQIVQGVPNFRYQLQLVSGEVEARIKSKNDLRGFFNALYGGTGPNGEPGFIAEEGLQFEILPKLSQTRLMTDKELDYYVNEYSRHGIHGPLNWYRTRQANHTDELAFTLPQTPPRTLNHIPILFISASRDVALKPSMAKNMGKHIKQLTTRSVPAGHWALVQKPEECNGFIRDWLVGQGLGVVGKGKVGSKL